MQRPLISLSYGFVGTSCALDSSGAAMAAITFSTAHQPFPPLDPDIVSDAIPAFFIGRNKNGFWVARDASGTIGGIFLLETSALTFARANSEPAGCAIIVPSERFELDLANDGNPLAGWLERLMRLAQGFVR